VQKYTFILKYPYFSQENVVFYNKFATFAVNYDELAATYIQQTARTGAPSS
jgi:hypothetical protein